MTLLRRRQVGDSVDAIVELLKENSHYLVASIPGLSAALGFAASRDQNTFGIDAGMRFAVGQSVTATIAALPEAATGASASLLHMETVWEMSVQPLQYCGHGMTLSGLSVAQSSQSPINACRAYAGGRMLLMVPLREKVQSKDRRKRQRHEKVEPGSIVQGTVVEAHLLHVDVQLANGGSPHITCLCIWLRIEVGSLPILVEHSKGTVMSPPCRERLATRNALHRLLHRIQHR